MRLIEAIPGKTEVRIPGLVNMSESRQLIGRTFGVEIDEGGDDRPEWVDFTIVSVRHGGMAHGITWGELAKEGFHSNAAAWILYWARNYDPVTYQRILEIEADSDDEFRNEAFGIIKDPRVTDQSKWDCWVCGII